MPRKAEENRKNPGRARLCRAGITLGERTLPLLAGSVHYFRLDPADWRPALEALQELGLGIVDTYIPWGVHELSAGVYDFGERDPKLDIVSFLRLAGELGLVAFVRPGPHINAELTHFGIPERIIWDPECQARSARGRAVVLPVPPLAFPVPSYASKKFMSEAAHWLAAIGERLAPLCYPHGPIVLCQVDNEGAMYFRDGVYDQDYHPDSIPQLPQVLEAQIRDAAGARTGARLPGGVPGARSATPIRRRQLPRADSAFGLGRSAGRALGLELQEARQQLARRRHRRAIFAQLPDW
ncbi:MAG: beta-galactosidase [Polyangiaceae bacterium]